MAEKTYCIIHGDSAQELKHIPDNTMDAVITDPPYGIEFLGKDWDSNTGAVEIWQQCLRILRPGGHLLAFSAARTYHHLAMNIESVGFEIRDQLMWIYSSGFPKAQDMGKAIAKRGQKNNWHGWKTALKPGHEPIVMARKRFKGSTMDNIQRHGVGALNIDATRIAYEDQQDLNTYINNIAGPLERSTAEAGAGIGMHEGKTGFKVQKGRVKRPQAGHRTASFSFGDKATQPGGDGSPEFEANPLGRFPSNVMGEITDYQKYFYCPKVTRRERNVGCVDPGPQFQVPHGFDYRMPSKNNADPQAQVAQVESKRANGSNNHPTVKPVMLMRYLIQLVTPPHSHIVDPFTGSGTTGMAATELGHTFTGIEQDPAYVEIANKRIKGWLNKEKDTAKHSRVKQHTDTAKTAAFDRLFE